MLREHTDKPVKYLVLTHYHAVRVGASAFDAQNIITSDVTRTLIEEERGMQDWASEFGRMPRLFREPEGIPGLTHPTITFNDRLTIPLGGTAATWNCASAAAATAGDIIAWLPRQNPLYRRPGGGRGGLCTGDASHFDWSSTTLDNLKALEAEQLVGGRGAVARGREAVDAAIRTNPGIFARHDSDRQ